MGGFVGMGGFHHLVTAQAVLQKLASQPRRAFSMPAHRDAGISPALGFLLQAGSPLSGAVLQGPQQEHGPVRG